MRATSLKSMSKPQVSPADFMDQDCFYFRQSHPAAVFSAKSREAWTAPWLKFSAANRRNSFLKNVAGFAFPCPAMSLLCKLQLAELRCMASLLPTSNVSIRRFPLKSREHVSPSFVMRVGPPATWWRHSRSLERPELHTCHTWN